MPVYVQIDGGSMKGGQSELSGKCDLCGEADQTTIYDARVPRYGAWAHVCQACFDGLGCRLGVGFGQKYELKS